MIVDYFCLRSTLSVKILGPFVTLFIAQSKGWPCVFFWWAVNDFCFLYRGKFARHWLFWQDAIELVRCENRLEICTDMFEPNTNLLVFSSQFNDTNPAGSVISSSSYTRVLIVTLVISFAVGLKRFWLSLHLGKSAFSKCSGTTKYPTIDSICPHPSHHHLTSSPDSHIQADTQLIWQLS